MVSRYEYEVAKAIRGMWRGDCRIDLTVRSFLQKYDDQVIIYEREHGIVHPPAPFFPDLNYRAKSLGDVGMFYCPYVPEMK